MAASRLHRHPREPKGTTDPRGLRDRAHALRLDHDLSIRAIAGRLNVPRSTVGDWLRGEGEATYRLPCLLCREDFIVSRAHAVWCSHACRHKYQRVFGPTKKEH